MRIAIIGAGLSGLACARELARTGLRVTVFEKSRSLCGRCATRKWKSHVADHGAQYFTVTTREFRDFLESKVGEELFQIEAPILAFDGAEISAKHGARYCHLGGNNRLGKALAEGLDIRLETAVGTVEKQADNWLLCGEIFDAVVSCAPWPQTSKLMGIDPGFVRYEKNLTCFLEYDFRADEIASPAYAFQNLAGDTPLQWVACENRKAGRIKANKSVFVAQASAMFSAENFDAPAESWMAKLRPEVEALWGLSPEKFSDAWGHRWGFARKIGSTGEPLQNILPDRFYLCGDSVVKSRIEDVYHSGLDTAATVWRGRSP